MTNGWMYGCKWESVHVMGGVVVVIAVVVLVIVLCLCLVRLCLGGERPDPLRDGCRFCSAAGLSQGFRRASTVDDTPEEAQTATNRNRSADLPRGQSPNKVN